MLTLFIGGQKSGKSKLAEEYSLRLAKNKKPYYIATYDNSYDDKEMKQKIKLHKKRRKNKFKTINESLNLPKILQKNKTYLVDCISMWILNNIKRKERKILKQLKKILKFVQSTQNTNIVFVLNDVNSGVAPLNKLSKDFINRTGIVGQYLSLICDEVYEVKFGLATKLK